MMDHDPRRLSPAVRIILWLVTVVVIFFVVLGVVFWRAPIWAGEKITQLQLYSAGIHSHSMNINGHHVHYIEGGTGQPVVLIHGLGSQAQNDWVQLAPRLVRAGYHVYAPDLLGYGRSAKPVNNTYSIPEEAKFVESFLDANHLGAIALGGVSMGGWVASAVALDQPQRVTRLMLFDSAGMKFELGFDRGVFTPQTTEQVSQLMTLVTPNPPPMPDFVKQDFIRRSKRHAWVVQRALASMMAGTDDLDEKFSALKMPLLIVWGKQDAMTPLSVSESMHRAAPQSVLAVYEGCGHIAVVMCIERIAPTVLDFLSGGGPPAGQPLYAPLRTP